jgi:hypothetical protein
MSEEIRLLIENLTLGVALLEAADRGIVTARLVSNQNEFLSSAQTVTKPLIPLEVNDNTDLIRRANNQIRAAFVCSAIHTNYLFSAAYGAYPDSNTTSDIGNAHCIIYLISCAVDRQLITPVWECHDNYKKVFDVSGINFRLDARNLNGHTLRWSDFGDLGRYNDLLEYCASEINDVDLKSSEIKPEQIKYDIVSKPKETPKFEMAELDSLDAFIQMVCSVGSGEMVMAKSLYLAYSDWCIHQGYQPLVQRSFGMRLTASGFERRRRGRGKHWWVGISVEEMSLVSV